MRAQSLKKWSENKEFFVILLTIIGLIVVVTYLGLFFSGYTLDKFTAFLTGVRMSVYVKWETSGIFYEDENNSQRDDNVFQLGPISIVEQWHSYNGSYGGVKAGYDIGYASDGVTQTFAIENTGSSQIDVLIASEDFDNGTIDGKYIEVSQSTGYFQVYIPGLGWRNIPDNSNEDADHVKDDMELCIVNDLPVGGKIMGIDFQVKAPASLAPSNYTAQITLTPYDSSIVNPCNSVGEYVNP